MKKQDKKNNNSPQELEAQVAQLSAQITDLDSKLRTALADYQNIRKEVESQQTLREAMVKKHVFGDLIDLFTDLFFAVEQIPTELQKNSHVHGVIHIMEKYKDILKAHGVTEISYKEGDAYDSKNAEVLGIVNHAEMDGVIAQLIQPGYRIGDVLVKSAKVMIYKKQQKQPASDETQS